MHTESEFHAYLVELLTTGDAPIPRLVARECADQIIETLRANPQMTRWIADGASRARPKTRGPK
jgi:hypothetical protein